MMDKINSIRNKIYFEKTSIQSFGDNQLDIISIWAATDNTSTIHTPQTQNPTPPINIWNDSARTSKMCENLEIAVKSSNNQAPLVDIEKLVVDKGQRYSH